MEGSNTELSVAPDKQVTVVVLSKFNTSHTGPLARRLMTIAFDAGDTAQ